MLRTICFSIPLKPVAASRPRVTSGRVFYEKIYEDFKKAATQYCFLAARSNAWKPPHPDKPIYMRLEFVFPTTRSLKEFSYHVRKPDIDNLEKSVLDAIVSAGILIDDCQVCHVEKKKWVGDREETGRIKVTLKEIEDVSN